MAILTNSMLRHRLAQYKIVPIMTIEQHSWIKPLAELLIQQQLPVIEITFRSPLALQSIHTIKQQYPQLLVGAGTVLTQQQLTQAVQAGADFIVTPGFNPQIVASCQACQIPIIPGVNNPSHIEQALEHGIDFVKFFPAEASGGVAMLNALLAPYQQLQLMPTGGITAKNLTHYLAIKQVVACGGSWMLDPQLCQTGQWQQVAERIAQAVRLANS